MVYGLLFVIYGFFAYFQPKYALGLMLFLLPTYQIKFQIFKIPFTFLEIMILILFAVWLAKNTKNKELKIKNEIRRLKNSSWFWLICVWLAIATVSMFVAPDLRAAAGVWKAYFIEPILFLLVLLDLAKNNPNAANKENVIKVVFFSLSASVFGCSVWAILQKWLGGGVWSAEVWGQPLVWRAAGPFPHPNFLGLYLAPLIVLGVGYLIINFRKKCWVVICHLLFIILAFWALVLSRSEGAIFGVLAGFLLLGLVLKKSRKYVLIGLMIFVILAAVYPVSRHYLLEKALLRDLSGQFRLNIWSGAVSLLKNSPILGVGLDGYERLVAAYQANNFVAVGGEKFFAPTQPYPHNLFLAIWLELGLVGLIIFIWILFKFFKQGVGTIKNQDVYSLQFAVYSVMDSMVAVIVHGLVDTPYFKNDLAIVFWLIIGLGIILKDDYENQISDN